MLNKKSVFTIFLAIIFVYCAAYFYIQNRIEKLIAQNLGITEEQIIKSGSPFKMKYKYVDDQNIIFRLSLSILSKRVDIELLPIKGNLESLEISKVQIPELMNLSISAKIDSYIDLFAEKSIGLIKFFNMTNDYNINVTYRGEESRFVKVNSSISLKLPGKRKYQDLDDLLKDIPNKYIIESHGLEELENDSKWPFLTKLTKEIYPKNAHTSIKIIIPKNTDLIDYDTINLIKLLSIMDLKLKTSSTSNGLNTKLNIDIDPKENHSNIKLESTIHCVKDFIQKLYKSTSRDEFNDFILFTIDRMGLRISDDTKDKIKNFVEVISDRTEKNITSSKAALDMYYDFKSTSELNVKVFKELGEEASEFSFKSFDNRGMSELSLDAKLSEKIPSTTLSGKFYASKVRDIAALINDARYLSFALNNKIKIEEYNSLLKSYEKSFENIIYELKKMSDDKNKDSLEYTFEFSLLSPKNGIISKSNTKLIELVDYISGLFRGPEIE